MKRFAAIMLAMLAVTPASAFTIELGDSYWPGTDRPHRHYRNDPFGGVYGDYNRPRRKRPYVDCRKSELTMEEAEYCARRARRRSRSQ
jgi:hypothetical protein